mgnify:CR=1 FL=1
MTMGTGRAQWWPYQLHDGRRSAVLRCPACGLPAFVTDHDIETTGAVQGPFVCRGTVCGFRARLRLRGWTEEDVSVSVSARPD